MKNIILVGLKGTNKSEIGEELARRLKMKFIDTDDLPSVIMMNQNWKQKTYQPISLKQALEAPEKNLIRQALQANYWNRQETAKALQINRTTLFKKMKHYGLYAEAEKLGLT